MRRCTLVTTFTWLGLIDDIVIFIIVFLVVSLKNTDGTFIQGANSALDLTSCEREINQSRNVTGATSAQTSATPACPAAE